MIQSIYQKIKSGLKRTRQEFTGKIEQLFSSFKSIDEEMLERLEEILIQSDIGVEITDEIIENLRCQIRSNRLKEMSEIIGFLKQELTTSLMADEWSEESFLHRISQKKPFVILMVGVNGTGKTTTIGKLASFFSRSRLKVMIAASDTFRAAAVEQLQVWAERSGAAFISHNQANADPAAVAYDAYQAAQARGFDVLLIDTAGRLHTKSNLMEELKKIERVLKKASPEIPHETWIVIDGNSGQNAMAQTDTFLKSIPLTGLVVTKLDGTAHGGVVLAIHKKFNLPIRLVGVGEQFDDIQLFNSRHYVDAMFDNR